MVPLKQDDSENAHEHGRHQIEYDADRAAGGREHDQRNYRLQLSVVAGDGPPARVAARRIRGRIRAACVVPTCYAPLFCAIN